MYFQNMIRDHRNTYKSTFWNMLFRGNQLQTMEYLGEVIVVNDVDN